MEHQRPRTWTARLTIAALCGLLVAMVSLMGYDPSPRSAGAAIQPAPTSIAFVPMHPEPVDANGVQARAVQAGRMMAMPDGGVMVAPAGGPEPIEALLPDPEACSFPCFDPDRVEDTPAEENAGEEDPAEQDPGAVVDLSGDTVEIEASTTD